MSTTTLPESVSTPVETSTIVPDVVTPPVEALVENAPVATPVSAPPVTEPVYDVALASGSLLQAGDLSTFLAEAKASGLTPAQAKGEWAAREKIVAAQHQTLATQWTEQTQAWAAAAKADPEMGGDKWEGTTQAAKRAVDRFASPELRKELDVSGMGNHPELIRLFAKIGRGMAEDGMIGVTAGQPGQKSEDAALRERFPTMYK